MRLSDEFCQLKDWTDPDGEYTYDNFHSDLSGGGMIIVLNGDEPKSELQKVGLSDGWEGVVPEDIRDFKIGGERWYRLVVVYTDSCSVAFFIKHLPQILEKYIVSKR